MTPAPPARSITVHHTLRAPSGAGNLSRMPNTLRWRGEDGGLEHAAVGLSSDGLRVESVVIAGGADGEAPFALTYTLICDSAWCAREMSVRVVGTDRRIMLRSDGNGRWEDGGGAELTAFRGCMDVDLTVTPLTNTLPIRRLAGRLDGGAVIRVLYIEAPGLRLSVSGQRYTRLDGRRYRFELTDGSFARDITVDAEGFVLDYPGLFSRA